MADLLACLDDPALALLQWTEAFNVVQARHVCLRHPCMLRWVAEGAADPNPAAFAQHLDIHACPAVLFALIAFSLPVSMRCCDCIDMMTCPVPNDQYYERRRGCRRSWHRPWRALPASTRRTCWSGQPAATARRMWPRGASSPPASSWRPSTPPFRRAAASWFGVGLLGCYMHMPVCTSRSKQQWCCLERTVFVARMRHGLACDHQSHFKLHTSKSAE